jgi:hypothetical protein
MNKLAEGFHLIDSDQRLQAYPQTWEPVPVEQLNRIAPLWLVKIGVVSDHPRSGERFWCRVQKVGTDGIVVKVVQRDMLFSHLHQIEDGDVLTVEPRHILDLLQPADQ